jgi:hypothetical protein
MLDAIWEFLQVPINREVLGWMGAGLVVMIGGLWAAYKFYATKEKPKAERPPQVIARDGGVAIGGANIDSPINTTGHRDKNRR